MPNRTRYDNTDIAPRADQAAAPKGSIFDEISVTQLAAGAMAAVVSLLLSSRIGIAGSVIGAAVGSIVTAVSAVVFRRALNASASKVKQSADKLKDASSSLQQAFSSDAATAPIGAHAAASAAPSPYSREVRVAPEALRERAAQERGEGKQALQRKVAIVSLVAGLVAVAIMAGFVLLTTNGNGLGPKPEQVFTAQSFGGGNATDDTAENNDPAVPSDSSTTDQNVDPMNNNAPDQGGNATGTDQQAPATPDTDANTGTGTDASAADGTISDTSGDAAGATDNSGATTAPDTNSGQSTTTGASNESANSAAQTE